LILPSRVHGSRVAVAYFAGALNLMSHSERMHVHRFGLVVVLLAVSILITAVWRRSGI
jgi:hypothetical protein